MANCLPIQAGGMPHRVLVHLLSQQRGATPMMSDDPRSPLHQMSTSQRRHTMARLQQRGLITSDYGQPMRVTEAGIALCRLLGPCTETSGSEGVTPGRLAVTPADLPTRLSTAATDRPLALRPGALDHTQCPSRMSGDQYRPYAAGRYQR